MHGVIDVGIPWDDVYTVSSITSRFHDGNVCYVINVGTGRYADVFSRRRHWMVLYGLATRHALFDTLIVTRASPERARWSDSLTRAVIRDEVAILETMQHNGSMWKMSPTYPRWRRTRRHIWRRLLRQPSVLLDLLVRRAPQLRSPSPRRRSHTKHRTRK